MGKWTCAVEKVERVENNFWRHCHSIFRIICFVIILAVILHNVFLVLRFKNFDGIYNFEKFYQLEDNSVDVLILGSSHAFETFNTGYLYENYGIAAYVLGGSAQPVWNTYYYLKEALKTQKPKMIVLEGFSLALWKEDFGNGVSIIKNTYGMNFSGVKLENMMVSIPEGEFTGYFPEYIQSHSRYSKLGKNDFADDQGEIAFYKNWHGFNNVTETTPCESPDVDSYSERLPLLSKSEEYFRKVLELAHDESIPVVVIVAPYARKMTTEHQMEYNTVKDIADEYEVDFINFNSPEMYREIDLDFDTDFSDGEHLNYIGNVKVSKYMADYILSMTDMPDRRYDPRYISWELEAACINAANRNKMLTETTEMEKIIDIFDSSEYVYFISHNIPETSEQIDKLKRYFGFSEDARGEYLVNGISKEIVKLEAYTWYELEGATVMFDSQGINIKHSRFHPENGNIDYMDSFYKYTKNGMLIAVYDSVTLEMADVFYIDIKDDMNAVR